MPQSPVVHQLHLILLKLYRRLPTHARRFIVRRITPSFSVGSICVIQREDGAILFLRLSYRHRWGLPGGLLKRGEHPADAARREALEETGLEIEVVGVPAFVVAPGPRRVDIIYRCRLSDGVDPDRLHPGSAEVVNTRWFLPRELPELQHEASHALRALANTDPELRPEDVGLPADSAGSRRG